MRNIIIIVFSVLFCSCDSKYHENDRNTINKNIIEDIDSSIDNHSFLDNLPEFSILSNDSSWAIEFFFIEGQLEKYKIYYSDGTSKNLITKLPNDIIGGMDYSSEIWKNDTTLLLPNIGGTREGSYQMYIYKHGNYYFKHKKKKVQDEILETESGNNSESYNQPIIINQSTFWRDGEMLKFEYQFSNSGPRDIGCGGSSENWSLFVPANLTEFEFHKQEIEKSKFEYWRSGGNNFGHLVHTVSGTIKGKYLQENKWEIHLDVKILINDAHGNHEIQINRNQIFNPK